MKHYGDTEWRDKGRAAYHAGRGRDECPLRHWSDARCEWGAGWDEAEREDRVISAMQDAALTPRVWAALNAAKDAAPYSHDRQSWLDEAVAMAVFDGCGEQACAVIKSAFVR